jgi:NADH-quinone oxidoreductase subunit G
MDENQVTIEVDGVPLKARKGQMLIEVTDQADIYVPRFCYHKKLTIAANCRMCLVDVEKAPKPLPACATPVVDGMKVSTRSARAISAQKATMEFLLINHPLDCPICDQGGECELQDLAMGFGRGVSRYTERKRVVKDKNLGPLISTDMTRCIHCTRCVRFGQEIAGIQELGTIGRSEDMQITTYVEKSVDHELSGNIIDLCPVGALNSKPYRYSARAWEMVAKPLIAPHDSVGSNLYAHVLRGRVKRVVPRENEAVNETWISDRDRFSYEGIYAPDRLLAPMLKRNQVWSEVSWNEAVQAAADALAVGAADPGEGLGMLVSPSATLEEMYLLGRLSRHLGTANIDYRLRRRDFRDQDADPAWPGFGIALSEVDQQRGILVVGSDLRAEAPMLAHRVRKAALRGAAVGFVSPGRQAYHFRHVAVEAAAHEFAAALAGLLAAARARGAALPARLTSALAGIEATSSQAAAAAVLLDQPQGWLLLGQWIQRHPQYSDLRALAAALAQATGARLGYVSEGGNAAGAALTGITPHREFAGRARASAGLHTEAMISAPRHVYVLFGIEPQHDLACARLAEQALLAADHVIAFTSYVTPELQRCADILLPIGSFAETAGTYVNGEGRWQSFDAAAQLLGEARPGWRILRVLGNLLELPACDYQDAESLRVEIEQALHPMTAETRYAGTFEPNLELEPIAVDLELSSYAIDAVLRRADALQARAEGALSADTAAVAAGSL